MTTRFARLSLLLATAFAYEISLTSLDIPLKPCPPAAGQGLANCLINETCCNGMYFGASGCEVMSPNGKGTICCAPGAALNVSTTMPNVLIIGDSVSDQYTPSVARILNTTCLVQHAPWASGGSADNAANGLFNLLNCRWLRTAQNPNVIVKWDLIMYNFGLHDLMNTWDGKLVVYSETLENITDILQANAKQVLYALTTPFQADSLPSCGPYCNVPNATSMAMLQGSEWPQPTDGGNGRCGPPLCQEGALGCGVPNATSKAQSPDPNAPGCGPPTYAVTVLNDAASKVMASKGVPTLDLNSLVHSHCGTNYSYCEVRALFFPFPCSFQRKFPPYAFIL